jgi:hypothetical protein
VCIYFPIFTDENVRIPYIHMVHYKWELGQPPVMSCWRWGLQCVWNINSMVWQNMVKKLSLCWISSKWRWVVSFRPWPLYPWGESSHYPLCRRLGGSQSPPGCGGKEQSPSPCWESNPGCPAHSLVTILTEFFQLIQNMIFKKWNSEKYCLDFFKLWDI